MLLTEAFFWRFSTGSALLAVAIFLIWFWVREFQAWPSKPEWVSAAFDYNVAPFFQSFVEVRVEPSANRVRLRPWGVHGRLRWRDLQTSESMRSPGVSAEDEVEWSFAW